jgi:hypothetical protein
MEIRHLLFRREKSIKENRMTVRIGVIGTGAIEKSICTE